LGINPAYDHDLNALIESAREPLLPFATAEWVTIAPSLVAGFEGLIGSLDPGVVLGGSFSVDSPGLSQPAASGEIPASSKSSLPSPSTLPPMSRTPSTGSDVSRTSPRDIAPVSAGPATRPTRPLPKAAYRQPGASASSSSRTVRTGPTLQIPVIITSASSSGPSPVESNTRSSKKRFVQTEEPMAVRPDGWDTCQHCRKRKQICRPPKGSRPPFGSCTTCLNEGTDCVPCPKSVPPGAL
jgi:hypothetical protein